MDVEREVIEHYFHLGYKYDLITQLLKNRHGIEISIRTLKRRLNSYQLFRRKENENFDEEHVRNIISQEIQGAGSLAGYRKILRLKHHIHVPRQLVASILKELDPEASTIRRMKRLRRRQYISQGPNQCWHIDGVYTTIFYAR